MVQDGLGTVWYLQAYFYSHEAIVILPLLNPVAAIGVIVLIQLVCVCVCVCAHPRHTKVFQYPKWG